MRAIRIIWASLVTIVAMAQFAGGDTSILAGWSFLVLSAPVGPLWWFYVYPLVGGQQLSLLIQYTGTALAVLLAYAFWFVAVPAVWRTARGHSASNRGP